MLGIFEAKTWHSSKMTGAALRVDVEASSDMRFIVVD
jgi:hypothetical protein